MSISDALARKLATYVVLTKRVEDRVIRRVMEAIEQLWDGYRRRMSRLGEVTPLDIMLYEFQVQWRPTKVVAELYAPVMRTLEELGRGAVLVTVDEVLKYRPDLKGPLTQGMEDAFAIYGQPGAGMFTAAVAGITPKEALERFLERMGITLENGLREQWAEAFHQALMEGLTPGQAVTEAARRVGIDWGALEDRIRRNTWQVERIVRTHSMASVNMAQHLFCQSLAKRGLVVGERWVATPDMVTCPECAALDGQIWRFEGEPNVKDRPSLPRHPNCRCTIVPVLAPEYDPEPIKVFTYEEWFEGLSEEKQRAILGDEGYEAWRRGVPLREALLGQLATTKPADVLSVAQAVAEAVSAEAPPGPRYRGLWGDVDIRVVDRDIAKEVEGFERDLAVVLAGYYNKLADVFPNVEGYPVSTKYKVVLNVSQLRVEKFNGVWDPGEQKITLNLGSILQEMAYDLKISGRSGKGAPEKHWWHAAYRQEMLDPRLYVAYNLRHEMAHHLDYVARMQWAFARAVGRTAEEVARAMETIYRQVMDKQWAEKTLGKYAAKEPAEGFAEAVALYTSPFYDGRLPKEVEEALDLLFGGRARVEYIREVTRKLALVPLDWSAIKERV